MQSALILLVDFYHVFLSPWFGERCRFSPSCSCYARAALIRHGTLRGTLLTVQRLMRCHPFHAGGHDPV